MTISDFQKLALMEQARVAWGSIRLGQRVKWNITVELYKVEDFYIELYLAHRLRIKSFSDNKLLKPWIGKICLKA